MSTSRPSDDELGRMVLAEGAAWAREHPGANPAWTAPWEDDFGACQRELCIRVGRALFDHGLVVTLKTMRGVLEETP